MKTILGVALLALLLSACSNVNYDKGFVRAIELEPRETIAGEQVRIFVELHDPYIYAGAVGAGPRVLLTVDGGVLAGRAFEGPEGSGSFRNVSGQSIEVLPHLAMLWTLPTEPGSYKLDVTFDGDTRTKRIEIE